MRLYIFGSTIYLGHGISVKHRIWGCWLRVLGYTFSVALDRPVVFSERYGYEKVYRYKRVSVKFMKPRKGGPGVPQPTGKAGPRGW